MVSLLSTLWAAENRNVLIALNYTERLTMKLVIQPFTFKRAPCCYKYEGNNGKHNIAANW